MTNPNITDNWDVNIQINKQKKYLFFYLSRPQFLMHFVVVVVVVVVVAAAAAAAAAASHVMVLTLCLLVLSVDTFANNLEKIRPNKKMSLIRFQTA